MVIRAKFGQFAYDAYVPSNIEVLFEFLNHFDEVPLPDGNNYRINDNQLEVKHELSWKSSDRSVTYFLRLIKDFTPEDWEKLTRNSKKDNLIRYPSSST